MEDIYDIVLHRFHRRYRLKKAVNLCITSVVAVLGITSFLYGLQYESFKTVFRWMTVDGTLFTTFCAIAFILVNLYEILGNTELTSIPIYYIRLSSVVAESVIFGVTLISQLPFFAEHIPIIDRYDSFVMHIMVPILSVTSFLTNDSSIGKLKPMERWRGTWFVTCYGVIIFLLIGTKTLPESLIPYFFLDYRKNIGMTIVAFFIIYSIGYLTGWLLSEWNRKLTWLWFKGIAYQHSPHKHKD